MHKLRGRIMSDNPAKKARLLHGCNLALLGLVLCTTLLAGAHASQVITQETDLKIQLASYEGQTVSSVELAGQPDLNVDEMMPLISQHGGDDFSADKITESIDAIRRTGNFKDVELDVRPEQGGVRVTFILQPAIYFGMYKFPGAERFPYNRLIVAANYVS